MPNLYFQRITEEEFQIIKEEAEEINESTYKYEGMVIHLDPVNKGVHTENTRLVKWWLIDGRPVSPNDDVDTEMGVEPEPEPEPEPTTLKRTRRPRF